MAKLKDKLQAALDETRMLVLGVQVLIGFGFRAILEGGFASLGRGAQWLAVAALAAELVAFALLLTPAAAHRICEGGEDTPALHRFTTTLAAMALLPFAFSLAAGAAIAMLPVGGEPLAWSVGAGTFGVVLTLWYGIELAARALGKDGGHPMNASHDDEGANDDPKTKLGDKIRHVMTELRVVLPGAQAILGFQFASTLMPGFEELPRLLKVVHVIGLMLVALATILLMMPAAWHRIVEDGEETPRFHALASATLLTAIVPLGLGMSADFFLVVAKVSGSVSAGWAAAAAMLAVFFVLWFGVTLVRRRASSPRTRARPSRPGAVLEVSAKRS